MNKQQINIAFTGWGSWWHILPIVSLIEYAQDNNDTNKENKNYFWFGESNSLEQTYAKQLSGVIFIPICSWKLRRYRTVCSTLQNIRDQFKVLYWVFQSAYYLKKHRISTLFCKWWYVALPVSIAAKIMWIPVLLHESDMHAWLTNRIVSKIAKTCFSWYSWVFPKKKEVVVWQILSWNLLHQEKITFPWLDDKKTTILVMWWSQWASPIFECISWLVETYKSLQFVVITWTKNQERKDKLTIPWHSWTTWFISQQQLAYIYSICDISITRGSVTSLAEQQLFGIKKIIVPLPFTWWNHQEYNADIFSEKYWDHKVLQNDDLYTWIEKVVGIYEWYKKDTIIDASDLFEAHKIIWSYL